MRPNSRWIVGLVAVLAVLAISAAFRQDDNKSVPAPANPELDRAIYDSLREVINTGAAVYNKNDHAGCYRIFHGALLTVKPMLAHRPELQEVIDEALTAAEGDPLVWRRAFTLRAALDKIRARVNPKGKQQEQKKDDKGKDKPEVKDKPKDDQGEKDKGKKDDKDKKGEKDQQKKDDKDEKKDKDKAKDEELPPPMTEDVEP